MFRKQQVKAPLLEISETFLQSLTMVEVDLVVLSKELSQLAQFSGRITKQLRELRLSELEQE